MRDTSLVANHLQSPLFCTGLCPGLLGARDWRSLSRVLLARQAAVGGANVLQECAQQIGHVDGCSGAQTGARARGSASAGPSYADHSTATVDSVTTRHSLGLARSLVQRTCVIGHGKFADSLAIVAAVAIR